MGFYETPRNQVSPADFVYIDSPERDSISTIAGAAFRTENLVGDAFRSEGNLVTALEAQRRSKGVLGLQPKSVFNAWEQISGTVYEEYWDAFAGARSQAETNAIKRDIDARLRDRQILDRAGGRGIAASMIAGFLDIPTLVPGATAYRGATVGSSITRNALRTSATAAAEAVAVEAILHRSQQTRTGEESAFAVGGSIILGGVLGGTVGAFLRKTPSGVQAFDAGAEFLNGKDVVPGIGLDADVRKTEGIGADVVSVRPESSDFDLPTSTAQKVVDYTPSGTTFGFSFIKAQSDVAKKLGVELIDMPFAIRGVDRLDLEPSAETFQSVMLDRVRVEIGRAFKGQYAEYRKQAGIGRLDALTGRVGDGNLTEAEFNRRVAMALRRGDVDEIPEVQAAARYLRAKVIEPLKDKAIKAGLLPEDVEVSTAASYFTRMWDADEIIRRSDEFLARMGAKFRGDFEALRMSGEPGFDLSDLEIKGYADEAAQNVFETLTDRGRIPENFGVTVKVRGPLKERTLNVRDIDFEDFLNNDAEYVINRYARVMTAEIALKDRFGSTDLKQQISDVKNDYRELIQAAPRGEERTKLKQERDRIIERIEAVRDLMRGNYQVGTRSGVPYRVMQSAMTYNFIRALGGLVLSALPDVARIAMQNGMGHFMEGGLRPLASNLKQFKLQAKQARELAGIAEVELNNRLMRIADVADPVGNQTPVENALNSMGALASTLSGGTYWNDFLKGMATQVTTNRLRRLTDSVEDKTFLKRLKVNSRDALAIKDAMNKHGVEVGGVFDPRVDKWPERIRDIYAAALRSDAETVIVTPGLGDKVPAAEHHFWLKPALQFKSFALAAHSRVMLAGLQENQTRFLMSSMTMSSMGMFVYWLKVQSSGREPSENLGTWLAEGIDRSGVFPLIMEVNNVFESIGAPGVYSILSMGEDEASRYAVRSTSGKVLGPTAGLIEDTATVLSRVLAQLNPLASENAKDIKAGDIAALRRLIPFGRHPGFKEYLDLHLVPNLKAGVE